MLNALIDGINKNITKDVMNGPEAIDARHAYRTQLDRLYVDFCHHCSAAYEAHVGQHCPFDSTMFFPMTRREYVSLTRETNKLENPGKQELKSESAAGGSYVQQT